MKKTTSSDVALKAGVSQSAVSLILNSSEKVFFSSETKERVFAVAAELGYKLPARKKQAALHHRTNLLLVLTPTLTNQYYTELIQAIESYADTLGYRVLVCNTFRKPELEKYYLETLTNGLVDGIVYSFLPSFPRRVEVLSQTTPTVILGEKQDELDICSVELSNHKAGALLAEHLYSLGHKKYAFISTPVNRFTLARKQRLEGVRATLEKYGIGPEALELIAPDKSTEQDIPSDVPYEYHVGYQLAQELLKRGSKATALMGVNDMTAIGIADRLRFEGFNVPQDYSVCGFDNIFASSIVATPLTTIDHQLTFRCKAAVDLLLSKIDPTNESLAAITMPGVNKIEYVPKLIVRESTARCKE